MSCKKSKRRAAKSEAALYKKGGKGMKKACMSTVKDPENRSKKKTCVCGFHSAKAQRSKKNKISRNPRKAHWLVIEEKLKQCGGWNLSVCEAIEELKR